MPIATAITAAEYLAGPEDRRRTELVDGVVIVHEPLARHQYVVFDLAVALREWACAQPGRGRVTLPLDVRLDEYNVFAPDILWYAEGRAPGRDAQRPSPTPDLAVEVRSRSTWRYDIGAKKAGYEHGGLPELWLVDTAADVVLAFRRSSPKAPDFDVALEFAREDVLSSPLLPGFALTLHELFGSEEITT
ncbi:MAG: Uma2 family endonuclease [Solirubrobacteraceae bacterium]